MMIIHCREGLQGSDRTSCGRLRSTSVSVHADQFFHSLIRNPPKESRACRECIRVVTGLRVIVGGKTERREAV